MKVSRKAPEPQEDEIQITLSQEEARGLAVIVGSNAIEIREVWGITFRSIYNRGFMPFLHFSSSLYNQLRNIV